MILFCTKFRIEFESLRPFSKVYFDEAFEIISKKNLK